MSCQVHSRYIVRVLLLQMNSTSFSIMLAPYATIDVLAEAQVLKSSTPEHVALYAHQALCHSQSIMLLTLYAWCGTKPVSSSPCVIRLFLAPYRKLMTVANDQHAKECELEHQSESILMEELGRLLGEVKASARYESHVDAPSFVPPSAPACAH